MANAVQEQNKILEVKNLRISFRTDGGTVKAVRGISFSLYRGRTLAIVGESGSGKSVTSKAILGILANNKIIEGGQILYDGKDLLQLDENQFSKIRGVKISMIFQDPLSSLNPIMIVGKQLTEAMVLKDKADKAEAKKNLKKWNAILSQEDAATYANLEAALKADAAAVNKDDYSSLFLTATQRSVAKQNEAIQAVLSMLKDFVTKIAPETVVSFPDCYHELKPVFQALKDCELSVAANRDNLISVFPVECKNFVRLAKEGLEHEEKLKKNLEHYHVDSFYDLPAQVRAKSREVIVSQEEYTTNFKAAVQELIVHLENLLNRDEKDIESLGTALKNAYFEAIEKRNHILTKHEAKERAIELLGEVGINEPEKRYHQYPFELSGGMRQRIVIAIALCSSPEVLICDEPTTALDVTIQSQILELINKLKKERNLSIIFITHDLGVVANMADDIAVMYAGKIVEYGTATDIFYDPRHPYTRALLGSVPDLNTKERLNAIPGTPPNMLLPPRGDAFASRNKDALEIDYLEEPPFCRISPTHYAASWTLYPEAPDLPAPKIVVARVKKALKEHPEFTPQAENRKNSILNEIEEEKDHE